MLRLFKFVIKFSLFSAFVLVVANLIQWHGQTLSDQVKVQLSHAERSQAAEQVKGWTRKVKDNAKSALHLLPLPGSISNKNEVSSAAGEMKSHSPVEILPSERQKLRALIQELNTSQREN
jgi:hypothetical protein